MKTTIDIADPILEDARKLAAREGITVKALVESSFMRIARMRRAKRMTISNFSFAIARNDAAKGYSE